MEFVNRVGLFYFLQNLLGRKATIGVQYRLTHLFLWAWTRVSLAKPGQGAERVFLWVQTTRSMPAARTAGRFMPMSGGDGGSSGIGSADA